MFALLCYLLQSDSAIIKFIYFSVTIIAVVLCYLDIRLVVWITFILTHRLTSLYQLLSSSPSLTSPHPSVVAMW